MSEFKQNYFEVFGLKPGWDIDLTDLAQRYRNLQRDIHPDKFASSGDREKRIAVQFASYVNEAHETLKSPIKRAEYLLKLHGMDCNFDSTTHADMDFLMAQMVLREALAEVHEAAEPLAAIDDLFEQSDALREGLLDDFAKYYADNNIEAAFDTVSKLHFVDKLGRDIRQLESRLLDA